MPTYAYKCAGCEHEFELIQPITAKPIRKCPACGKLKAKRLLGTGVGIIFKGSGFYQTDYRSENYKKGADSDKGGGDKKETPASTSTPKTSEPVKPVKPPQKKTA